MTYTFEKNEFETSDGLNVVVKKVYDYDPDISYMGHFSDTWSNGAINHKRLNPSRGCYTWFIPTPGCEDWPKYYKDARAWYTRNGYSRHEAHTLADRARFQDYNQIIGLDKGSNMVFGIVVDVYDPTGKINLGHSSCYGYWWTSNKDDEYIEEEIENHINAALSEVKDNAISILTAVGPFADGAIVLNMK